MNALNLLLADASSGRPILDEGLHESAVQVASGARKDSASFLDRRDRDPNDLRLQLYGVMAPEGASGDELLEAIAPLIELRAQEQGAPVEVLRLPPDMTPVAANAWRDALKKRPASQRPRFLLMLGDLPQLSMDLQQTMAHSAFVGRLAFTTPDGGLDLDAYAAYARKVRAAAAPDGVTGRPEMLLYAAPDGTQATEQGNHQLVGPCHATLCASGPVQRFGRDAEPDPRAFLGAVQQARGGVLLSVTHGLTRPDRGWSSPEEQRARQGALSLSRDLLLEGEQVRRGPFLWGGAWFAVACFGAATPPRSAFHAWLELLARKGGLRVDPRAVLKGLPRTDQGERAFVAALPQAALANPEGPLAVISHSDLAWTYGFSDPDNLNAERSDRFSGVLESLADGSRVGVALDVLMDYYRDVNDSLRADHQAREDAEVQGHPDPVDPRRHGARWMLGNDLRGYVLLGDPAARVSRS